ncbi:MAG: hypothetical protein HFE60_12215 [Anaerotignum sp.]|nr:hypothetical protein [Anaerotignum sp.]
MKRGAQCGRRSWKINNDTMTTIVLFSLFFCAAVTIAGLVLGAFDHDVSAVIDSTHRIFGTELGICGLMKIYDKGVERSERKAAERRKRRDRKASEISPECEEWRNAD